MSTCAELHRICSSLTRYTFPFDATAIPKNGIYVLFERGELGHAKDRIVRVGTHTGKDQLPSRLLQHFVDENKDRSIFRKNIGRCLLKDDPYLVTWELDFTTAASKELHGAKRDLKREREIEAKITGILQHNFSFVVVPIDDKEERLALESAMISTVGQCEQCGPSHHWLGLQSPKAKIRTSGLWLVNNLDKRGLEEKELKKIRDSTLAALHSAA